MNEFCAKVLLFGEYSVVKGGTGLALPFFEYSGRLIKKAGQSQEKLVDPRLADFANYMANSAILQDVLEVERFIDDAQEGLRFESLIPQGSGVGSSGALCAAIYSEYQKEKVEEFKEERMAQVLDHMSLMESFYHGSSSGLDPLISLAQKPALVKNRNHIEFVSFKGQPSPKFYLRNTHVSRQTSPLVHKFLKMCEEEKFGAAVQEFIALSDELILSLLTGEMKDFDELFYQLSKWQYLNLKPMICPEIDSLWLEGLESKDYYVKLCGAGGGGHYIVYQRNQNLSQFEQACKIQF